MAAGDPTKEEIVNAIKESGYLMEQEVASIFEALGYNVETNRAYEDPDESKSREIDVRAISRRVHNEEAKLSLFVEIICECKNSSSPLAFLARQKTTKDKNHAPMEYVFPVAEFERITMEEENTIWRQMIPAFIHLGLPEHHYFYRRPDKAVQFCKVLRQNKSWKAEHGGIYDAFLYPLAKAFQSRRKQITQSDRWKYVWLFFPMIVHSGQIYYIDTSTTDLDPVPVSNVTFTRQIESKTVKGTFAVDFVTLEGLKEFMTASVNPFVEKIVDLANNSPNILLTKKTS